MVTEKISGSNDSGVLNTFMVVFVAFFILLWAGIFFSFSQNQVASLNYYVSLVGLFSILTGIGFAIPTFYVPMFYDNDPAYYNTQNSAWQKMAVVLSHGIAGKIFILLFLTILAIFLATLFIPAFQIPLILTLFLTLVVGALFSIELFMFENGCTGDKLINYLSKWVIPSSIGAHALFSYFIPSNAWVPAVVVFGLEIYFIYSRKEQIYYPPKYSTKGAAKTKRK